MRAGHCRGLLDADNRDPQGCSWLERYVRARANYMTEGRWMNPGWPGWRDLAERLRPDKMGKQERRKLPDLLESHPTRARCLKILRQPRVVSVYRAARGCVRGERERRVLLEGVLRSLTPLTSQALEAAENPARLIETVIVRHREVQSAKGKGMWIETGNRWTLLPGFGLAAEAPPNSSPGYLHTFRIPNAYSFLNDLGLATVKVGDEDA